MEASYLPDMIKASFAAIRSHLFHKCAGWSVSQLRQEDQPSQHAAVVESLSLWHAPCEHGETGKAIGPAALSCTLGSTSVDVGIISAILGLGLRLCSCMWQAGIHVSVSVPLVVHVGNQGGTLGFLVLVFS